MKTAANIGEFVNLYLKHQQQKIEMQTNKLGFNSITLAVRKTHSSTVNFYFCDPKTFIFSTLAHLFHDFYDF